MQGKLDQWYLLLLLYHSPTFFIYQTNRTCLKRQWRNNAIFVICNNVASNCKNILQLLLHVYLHFIDTINDNYLNYSKRVFKKKGRRIYKSCLCIFIYLNVRLALLKRFFRVLPVILYLFIDLLYQRIRLVCIESL